MQPLGIGGKPSPLPQTGMHIAALDSIRGIAAFTVMFGHCCLLWPESSRWQLNCIEYTPLRLLSNSFAAVTVFFVLSGYLLALPFTQPHNITYTGFVAKRICRLYVPFAVAIVFALTLFGLCALFPESDANARFKSLWPSRVDSAMLLQHFLMFGTIQAIALNGVIWTLVHEVRISILFPLLVRFSRHAGLAAIISGMVFVICTAILLAKMKAGDTRIVLTDNFATTWIITLRIVPFFVLGIILALHKEKTTQFISYAPTYIKGIAWCIILGIYCLQPRDAMAEVYFAAAAAMSIMLIAESPATQCVFEKEALVWLGRISYSLYLVHLPILLFLGAMCAGNVAYPVIVIAVICCSLVTAEVMCRWVELPSIRLGRRLAKKL